MSKDQTLGAVIVTACFIVAVVYVGFLFFYEPYLSPFVNLGSGVDVRFWLVAAPVAIAFVAILAVGSWIGYTMATTPSPKPIEEIASVTEAEKQQNKN
jgi:hypothetical protein